MQKVASLKVLPDNPLHLKCHPISSPALQGPYVIWPLPACPVSRPFLVPCLAQATTAFGFRISQAPLVLSTFVLSVPLHECLSPNLHMA